jgi:hypothetical protein
MTWQLRFLVLSAVLACTAAGLPSPVRATGDTLILYSDKNLGGRSVTLTSNIADLHARDFDDVASSLRWTVGAPAARASLYSDAYFAGTCQELGAADQTINTLVGSTVGNDSISSVRVG